MDPFRADRNLLFGILALQMDFITRDALISGMVAWVMEKHRPIGDILVERGSLDHVDRAALDPMMARHIAKHGGDPAASLAALGSIDTTASALRRSIADPEVLESLASIPSTRAESPNAARAGGPFEPPPAGTRYQRVREHAKGGLGIVFVARDQELNREVALKEIQDHHADDPTSRARFLIEAEVTGGLEHPGIVPVYGLGIYEDGRPYYAMRFIKGDSLKRAIHLFHEEKGAARDLGAYSLKLRQLLKRFLDVCNAISYAHSRGVLHRDMKPDNILLGPYGETLVVDWGLAKVIGRAEGAGHPEETLRPASVGLSETLPGLALGTPAYMSPEQAAGRLESLGPASDVYGLGATLYSLLTGQVPFKAPDLMTVRQRVMLGEFPPPRQVCPEVAPALEAICLKAMALKPEDRYATPLALLDEIEHWLADEPVVAYPEGWGVRFTRWVRQHRAWAWSGAMASLIVFLVLILWAMKAKLDLANVGAQRSAERGARLDLALGQALCEEGQIAQGIAWITRALGEVPDDQDDLEWEIRTSLDIRRRQVNRLRFDLEQRTKLEGVAFSPDGKRAISGGEGGARIWDTVTGRAVGSPIVEGERVRVVAFSPDGRLAVTVGSDGFVRFWNPADGSPAGAPLDHGCAIKAMAFSADGKALATGSYGSGAQAKGDGWAQIWDVERRKPITGRLDHKGWVLSVAFSPDGKSLLTTGTKGIARLWDAVNGGPRCVLRHLEEDWIYVWNGAFSPDGRTILTASSDGQAYLWDAITGRRIGDPLKHLDAVHSAAFSPDGSTFVTGCGDGTLWRWNTATRTRSGEIMFHQKSVAHFISYSPDGRAILSSSSDGTARIWDAATGRPLGGPMTHPGRVSLAVFDRAGKSILTACDDGVARLWESPTSRSQEPIIDHEEWVRGVAFSPDGRAILTGGDDGVARLWGLGKPSPIPVKLDHSGRVLAVAYSPDGRTVATAGTNRLAVLWGTEDGRRIREFPHPAAVNGVAFSPDGLTILTACDDGVARLWGLGKVPPIASTLDHGGRVLAVAYSPDGRTVAAAGTNRLAVLWGTEDGRRIREFPHPAAVNGVAFSPDGRMILTGGDDGVARLWVVDKATQSGPSLRHQGRALAVAYSPDGRTVATGGEDRKAHLWDVASGRPIGPSLEQQLGWVSAIAYSPDGRAIVTGAADHTAKLWDVPYPVEADARRATLWSEVATNLRFDGDELRPLDYELWKERRELEGR
jgi:eukaryotic-like serine/threonine-protein kinase